MDNVENNQFRYEYPYQISTAIMIQNSIVKAVLIFCSKALIYKAFCVFGSEVNVRVKIIKFLSTEFLKT